MSLFDAFLNNQGNVIHKWKHYFPIYENHFQRFRNRSINFLEIGVSKGGSMSMWRNYFGPHAQIVGIDIDPNCANFEDDQIKIRIGDQKNINFLNELVDEFGHFDIVLDDGSHQMHDLRITFEHLYPAVPLNGIYFIEDLHTAYWSEFGGGLGNPDSFIEYAKNLIDHLNADYTHGLINKNKYSQNTHSIHFYDSCVVFEKGRYLQKSAPQIGKD